METLFNQVSESFENLLLDKKEHFTNDTINFQQRVLECCYNDTSIEETLNMLHYSSAVEKALNLIRNSNLNLAKYWIDYLDSYPIDLPKKAKFGVLTSYFQMLACYYYAKKEYLLANETLMKCLPSIEYLLETGVNEATLIFAEQQLISIHLNHDSEIETTISEINQLLKFVLLEDSPKKYKANIKYVFEDNQQYKNACIKYFFDSSCKKIHNNILVGKTNEKLYINMLFNGLNISNLLSPYNHAMTSINFYLKDDVEKFLLEIEKCICEFQKLPILFQSIILDRLSHYSNLYNPKGNQKLSNQIEKYNQEFLKITNSQQTQTNNNPLYFLK